MSSTRDADPADAPQHLRKLYPIIHDLQPLLEEDDFTIKEIVGDDAGEPNKIYGSIQGTLDRALALGAMKKRPDDADPRRSRYSWHPAAREHLREYLAELETLPCGCRCHVPDSRDDPDGVIACRYCGEQYREDFFKQLVRGEL
jgi:hypothetical protein